MKLCSMKPSLFTDILKSITHIKKRAIFFLQFKKRISAIEKKQINKSWEFPGGSVVRTLHSYC